MKIAINISQLYSQSKYRGVGTYTKNLLKYLKQFDKKNSYYEITALSDVKNNSDLVFIPYFSPFNLSLPLLHKNKLLVTIHDLIPLLFPNNFPFGLQGLINWTIQKQLLKKVNYVIADSEVSKKDIISLTGLKIDKIETVYPCISQIFKPLKDINSLKEIKDKYSLPNRFILYVGDCNWNKNVPILVRAVKELKATLVLVGKVFTEKTVDINHSWNKSLKQVFDLSANDPLIIKLGYIPDLDLVNLYNLASFYVQPSFYEGFGLSVIEALACGCPVLSSSGGSLAEVSGEAVEYFNPLNLKELVNKMNKMLQEPDLKDVGLSKRLNQAKKFTPLRFVERLNEVYSKIT